MGRALSRISKNMKNIKNISKLHESCRVCNSNKLTPYVDLGLMPLANNLENTETLAKNKQEIITKIKGLGYKGKFIIPIPEWEII